jgi:apolipoprotein N-acyltransferase
MRGGFRRFAIRAGLALLGTALFCGGALLPSLAFLSYVALVPWTVLYMGARTEKASPLYGLLAGYLCWIVCYRPMLGPGGWVPLATALFFVPAWLLFPLLARPIQRLELPRSITLPVIWVAVEWARLLTAAGHFDPFALGYSQAGFAPLVQIADVTGVYGISFLIAAVNGLLVDSLFAYRDSAWRLRILLRQPAIVVPAAAIAATFAAVIVYGEIRLETASESVGPRVALYKAESVSPVDVDLVVPPGSAPVNDLGPLVSGNQAMTLIGAQSPAEGEPGRTTSSALFVDVAGTVRGRYDKQILFPFSEYAPLDKALGVVAPPVQTAYRRLVREVWGSSATLTPGSHMTLFDLSWKGGRLPFAALIGAESVYPALLAGASRHGARFVVNLTSDRDAGGVTEDPLVRVCVLRAVENRVALVRAGLNGNAAFIDPQGRLRRAPAGAVVLSNSGTTAYAASHDAFALLCVAVSLWLLARALLGGRATMTPIPVPAGATT